MKKSKPFLYTFTLSTILLLTVGFLPKDSPYPFKINTNFPAMPVSPVNPVTVNGALLGRYLFYDPILSRDSSISCSSCHKQRHAFSDSPNTFSKGIHQQLQSRNTLPLFNLAWYKAFFWDGRAQSIEEQVFHPIGNGKEMHGNWTQIIQRLQRHPFYMKLFRAAFGTDTIDSIKVTKAIAQFERTLISKDTRYDRTIRKEARLNMDEIEGMELVNDMTKGNCLHCHTTDENGLGTIGDFSNNGLDAAASTDLFKDKGLGAYTGLKTDMGKFKIPSLRNLLFTAPYMHDGRFKTLEEVLDFYTTGLKISPTIDFRMEFAHNGGARLTKNEKRKIIAFLKTMSDSVFITNPEFSNPFTQKHR